MGGRAWSAGSVLTTDCRPVQRALLDQQADDAGAYDNQGYRLRGHQFSDADGGWRLETVVPGLYTGQYLPHPRQGPGPRRPRPHHSSSTPRREPDNDRDGIFQPELVLSGVRDTGDTCVRGRSLFVLAAT